METRNWVSFAFASTALHAFEPRDVSNTSEEACSVSYTCLSEKIKFPKRQQRCFHNVHGAGGVMGSEATGFPENNLHAAVGNKKCFANAFLHITVRHVQVKLHSATRRLCYKLRTRAVAEMHRPHLKLQQATVNQRAMSEDKVLLPFRTAFRSLCAAA